MNLNSLAIHILNLSLVRYTVRHLGVSIATQVQQTGERHFISVQYENTPKIIMVADVEILCDVVQNIYYANSVICQNNGLFA